MSLERRIGYHVPDVAVILQQCGYVINMRLCTRAAVISATRGLNVITARGQIGTL